MRLMKLETTLRRLIEGRVSLDKETARLGQATQRRFDRVAEQFEQTDRRMRQTDERIDRLVIAIGELIRGQNGKSK